MSEHFHKYKTENWGNQLTRRCLKKPTKTKQKKRETEKDNLIENA